MIQSLSRWFYRVATPLNALTMSVITIVFLDNIGRTKKVDDTLLNTTILDSQYGFTNDFAYNLMTNLGAENRAIYFRV
jgi:hypothetical protein